MIVAKLVVPTWAPKRNSFSAARLVALAASVSALATTAWFEPMPGAASHGTRTDWLALATRLPDADRARLNPGRILWMSPKRKRLDWATANGPGFYLHPLADIDALAGRLGAPPTTGAMMIDLLLRSDLAALTLYGFDFFASLSLSGRRAAADVPHDFAAEAAWVADLLQRDHRLTLIR